MKQIRAVIAMCLVVFLMCCLGGNSYGQYDSISHEGLNRTYLLHLPIGYTGNESLPLVIAMHGGFGSANNLQDQSELSVKADAEQFIVVYPEGVESALLKIRTWNAGWCCGYASANAIDDVGFINSLLDSLIANYSIDVNRIYATGMSNGGFMSYRLACDLSDRIAAIAPVASSMSLSGCNPTRAVPVIHLHSYQDASIPYLGGAGSGVSNHYNPPQDSVLTAWANFNNCQTLHDTVTNTNEYTFIKYSNCDCNYEIHQYLSQDGGHSWPGGVKTPIGDSVSQFIHATDLMWEFFQQHALNCYPTIVTEPASLSTAGFELFPNPTTGIASVMATVTLLNPELTIMNALGKVVKIQQELHLNLIDMPAGVYYISLSSGSQVFTRKLLLTH